jgi:hypothetical protein
LRSGGSGLGRGCLPAIARQLDAIGNTDDARHPGDRRFGLLLLLAGLHRAAQRDLAVFHARRHMLAAKGSVIRQRACDRRLQIAGLPRGRSLITGPVPVFAAAAGGEQGHKHKSCCQRKKPVVSHTCG